MGWADCGVDSNGRSIGYAFDAICDHPECSEQIDLGLSYACGGMHIMVKNISMNYRRFERRK